MIPFHREVMNLRAENLAGEIRRALGRVRKNGAAVKRRSGFSYAYVARAVFEDIRGMTEEGFSYVDICEALEANGFLPEGSEPRNLGRAMRREKARRQRHTLAAETERIADSAGEKPGRDETRPAMQDIPKPEPEKTEPGGKPDGHEWRRIAGSTEETGLGKLTKHPDGSFDFDWNN
jgi:hypothetical protein